MGCSACRKCFPSAKGKLGIMKEELSFEQENFFYNEYKHSRPQAMLLGLTNRCNLACTYCFVTQSPEDMTLETARQAVKWFLNQYQEDRVPTINFFGGEPLLLFDEIIVPIVEEFKEHSAFGITTNGVLLDADKVDYFRHHNIIPLLSFDGVPLVQNTQRPLNGKCGSSFDKIIDNIPYHLLRNPFSTIRMTLTAASIPHLFESFTMAEKLGFKEISICPQAFEQWGEEELTLLEEQFNKIALKVYKDLLSFKMPVGVPLLKAGFEYYRLWDTGQIKFNNAINRCGLGTTSCAITPKGEIIPCQEKTSNPTYIIGNVWGGINPGNHEEFLKWYFSQVKQLSCNEDCTIQEAAFCLADTCPARLEDMNFIKSGAECVFNKARARVTGRLYSLCADSINPFIKKYFQQGSVLT